MADNVDLIQIKNSNLDSDKFVELQGVRFQPAYKKRQKINPLDGQFSGTAYTIAKSDSIGVENPVFILRGVINTNDYSTAADLWNNAPSGVSSTSEDGNSMTNVVTLGYLIALWRDMTGTTKIKISFGDPNNQQTWKTFDQSTDEIEVAIDAINFSPRQDSEGNHLIDYTIACKEVKS